MDATLDSAAEYRRLWAEQRPNIPYGLCWCGCGEHTPVSKYSKRSQGQARGRPLAFIRGHHNRVRHDISHLPEPNPSGLCMCGCGEPAPIARQTLLAESWVRGKPIRYLPGHYNRPKTPLEPPNPSGLCMCGCGEKTAIAKRSDTKAGTVKGEPKRYLPGHSGGRGGPPMSAAEHWAWWADNTDVPYGYCWCGCGEAPPIATYSNRSKGYARGRPVAFVRSHATRLKRRLEAERLPEPNPSGLCMCGCGQPSPIARQTNTAAGWVKDKPIPYISGHAPRPLSAEQEDEACRRYQEDGQTCAEIGKDLGASRKAIAAVLERRGIERDVSTRSWSEERLAAYRTYDCDHSFFDIIDAEAKAYWLGFIAADGCNTNGFLSIGLSSRDRDHLFRLKADLGSEHPVRTYVSKRREQSFGKEDSLTSVFAVRSPQLTEGLAKHGVVPRKNLRPQVARFSSPRAPSALPQGLHRRRRVLYGQVQQLRP